MATAKKAKDEPAVEDDPSGTADSAVSESSEVEIDGYEPDEYDDEDDDIEDDDIEDDDLEDDDLPAGEDDDFGDDEDAPLPDEDDDVDLDSGDGPLLLSKDEEFEALDEEEEDDLEVEGLREGEFVCSDCRMVFRLTALADEQEMLCRDCV